MWPLGCCLSMPGIDDPDHWQALALHMMVIPWWLLRMSQRASCLVQWGMTILWPLKQLLCQGEGFSLRPVWLQVWRDRRRAFSSGHSTFSHTESTFCFFWIIFNLFGHLTEKNMPQTFCRNLVSVESVGLRAKCELGHMHDKVSLSTNLHNQVCWPLYRASLKATFPRADTVGRLQNASRWAES